MAYRCVWGFMITLESISFNHDTGSASQDALSIRRNATTALVVPEWRRGLTVAAEDCPVAYAIAPTTGQVIRVRARFRRTDPSLTSIWVRTFNPKDTRAQGCLYALLTLLGAVFVWKPPLPVLNTIGEVIETEVVFDASGEATVDLPLRDVQLAAKGVSIQYETWHWQYSVDRSSWTDFQDSQHKVYVLLDVPTLPWNQTAGSSSLPWTEVLDFACTWATGATTADKAAEGVTQSVNALGPGTFVYDCPGGGATHYAWPEFDCTSFLDRLRGGPGLGLYVNCSDCATFVSTFANAVGCDLWQSRMGYSFNLQEILAIGSTVWQTACGWGGFSYHEVAWKGACTANDAVFDACLHVDGDANPSAAPHTPLLPVNMPFGNVGAGQYRSRLATPSGEASCNPDPTTRRRRAII